MKRYVKAFYGMSGIKYKVYWTSPDGADCLLGGSPTLDGALGIAKRQAKEIVDSPWESPDRKRKFLDSISVIDVATKQDVTDADTKQYIKNLVSKLPSGSNRNKASLRTNSSNEQVLYVIKDSHGNQLSSPNPDDDELWDRVSSMEARGRRGLSVVVYTGK